MIAEYVSYHAIQRPTAVAIVNNGCEVSYPELDRQIGKFTRALRRFGLPRGSWAAIACDDRYIHWLLMIGFEELGVATISFVGNEAAAALSWLAKPDLVLSEHPPPVGGVRRHHAITHAWLQSIFASPADAGAGGGLDGTIGGPDETLRIARTSGTTGGPKRLALTRRVIAGRVRQCAWCHNFTPRTRYLVTLSPAVVAVYLEGAACFQAGGTLVFESRLDTARALTTLSITSVYLFPIMLGNVLERLPGAFPKPQELTILVGGAALSPALRERAVRRLASDVHERYSTVEAGYVASTDGSATGRFATVWPGIRVEIVDDRDASLPFGATGRVRIRNDYMVEGYLDDPETTARKFKGGWFYPGDLGILHGPRELEVVAREDELLNIGGIKIAPRELEERVLNESTIRDAGVCSIASAAGIEEVWLGVVAEGGDDTALLARVDLAFRPFQLGKFHVRKLASIPRNAGGKVDRTALRSALTAGLPNGQAPDRA